MSLNYVDEIDKRIDRVYTNHPEIPDHRQLLPWVTGI
jgi:hypothetical protein